MFNLPTDLYTHVIISRQIMIFLYMN